MAHKEQKRFCKFVRKKYKKWFNNVNVLDVGSLDVNGNNRYLFSRSRYTGIDIIAGKNVDVIQNCKDFLEIFLKNNPTVFTRYNTIISTEMLEHDKTWKESLISMYDGLKPGGLLLITCAGNGRAEHGTTKYHSWASPGTNDYYCNISNKMFGSVLIPEMFNDYHLEQTNSDLYFYGIKPS